MVTLPPPICCSPHPSLGIAVSPLRRKLGGSGGVERGSGERIWAPRFQEVRFDSGDSLVFSVDLSWQTRPPRIFVAGRFPYMYWVPLLGGPATHNRGGGGRSKRGDETMTAGLESASCPVCDVMKRQYSRRTRTQILLSRSNWASV
jgi:hypothetical protein